MATREEMAASVLDESLHVHFVKLRTRIRVYTHNKVAVDAIDRIIGVKHHATQKPSGALQWQCQKEWQIKLLLEACLPYMTERRELAEEILAYLSARTSMQLLVALRNVQEVQQELKLSLAGL